MPERFSAVEHGTLRSGQLANFTTQQCATHDSGASLVCDSFSVRDFHSFYSFSISRRTSVLYFPFRQTTPHRRG